MGTALPTGLCIYQRKQQWVGVLAHKFFFFFFVPHSVSQRQRFHYKTQFQDCEDIVVANADTFFFLRIQIMVKRREQREGRGEVAQLD